MVSLSNHVAISLRLNNVSSANEIAALRSQ